MIVDHDPAPRTACCLTCGWRAATDGLRARCYAIVAAADALVVPAESSAGCGAEPEHHH